MASYHFILTVEWPQPPGWGKATLQGTLEVTQDGTATRGGALGYAMTQMREKYRQVPETAAVSFFDLAPNQL